MGSPKIDVSWQVQEAKQRFSELVRSAQTGEPQFVTRHGEQVVVVLDIAEYRRLTSQEPDFKEFLRSMPEVDAEFERSADLPRVHDFAEPR